MGFGGFWSAGVMAGLTATAWAQDSEVGGWKARGRGRGQCLYPKSGLPNRSLGCRCSLQIRNTLTSDTKYQVKGFSKLSLGFVICQDSKNSLKAIILVVVVYYRERIQISIRQEKKPNMGPFVDLSQGVRMHQFPALRYDSMFQVLSTRKFS